MNSREKGVRGELEWAAVLLAWGYEARRGQQFSGLGNSPDVVHSIPGVHFEVKRTERLLLYDAMDQATRDAPDGSMPVVVHRRNRGEWMVVLSAADFLNLLEVRDAQA